MMNRVYASASRYTQGPGALDSLAREMVSLNLVGPVLVLAGPTVTKLYGSRLIEILEAGGFPAQLDAFGGETTTDEVRRVAAAARESGARIVIGAGGGKVIDTARAAAANASLACVNLPTVASTDSPCSALSITYSAEGIYQGFESFGRNPDLVLVDTEIILSSPERYFIAGMGDALSTVFEARACVRGGRENLRGGLATVAAVQIAEACFATVMADGRQALGDLRAGKLSESFDRVVEANTLLSGIGFESAGLAAAHGLHNAMTIASETHRYLHGEKVSFGVMTQLWLESQPSTLIVEVAEFCRDVGLPITLDAVGLAAGDDVGLQQIAQESVRPGGLMLNEPFEVTAEQVLEAMRAADRHGHQVRGP